MQGKVKININFRGFPSETFFSKVVWFEQGAIPSLDDEFHYSFSAHETALFKVERKVFELISDSREAGMISIEAKYIR